jgi:septum formation protein
MYRVKNGMSLVLASASPRRKEMLGRIGLGFKIIPADVDEGLLPGESAEQAARRLSELKARTVAGQQPGSLVLAADTLVVLGERIMGKPESPSQARDMLRALSGREHQVVSGFCLRSPRWQESGVAMSRIKFRELSAAEVAAYVNSGEPLDKAGAYAVQGQGAALVERVEGSYTNVVGMPLGAIVSLLLNRGVIEPGGEEE